MPPKQSFAEQMRFAKELQQMYGRGGNNRSQNQPRPSPGASRTTQGRYSSNARPTAPGRPMAGRTTSSQPAVYRFDADAVPQARIKQSTLDWLKGGPSEEGKVSEPSTPQVNSQPVKPQQAVQENIMPPKTAQPAQPKATLQRIAHQSEQPHQVAQSAATKQKTVQSGHVESKSSAAAGYSNPASIFPAMNHVPVIDAALHINASQRDGAMQIADRPDPGSAQVNHAESQTLNIVKRWQLRQAARKAGEITRYPDLIDVGFPPSTSTNSFFDVEDTPASLPPPLVPFQSPRQTPPPVEEEDLLQFSETGQEQGFGVLISPASARHRDKGESAQKITGEVEAICDIHFKPATVAITGAKPGPVAELGGCSCKNSHTIKKAQGLSSSKWADPGYQHPGRFPRNTEVVTHEADCPVRVAWEKDHPLESGASPATYGGAGAGTFEIRPRKSDLPEGFEFACPPKLRRLNPYALPFVHLAY